MAEWLINKGVGRDRSASTVYLVICFLIAMACGWGSWSLGAPEYLAVGLAFFLGTLSLLPIARLNYPQGGSRNPAFLLFRGILDRNFLLGFLLVALTWGLVGGVVAYFVV